MAIDFETDLGRVRLLIADLDEDAPIFTDLHLEGYLSLNAGSVYRAAADALDAMATTDALMSRKIRTQDLSTDGPAVAAELRKQAVALRAKADVDDADAPFLDVVGFHPYCGPEGTEYRL